MMEHSCQGMTLGDHSKAICTICGADLSKPAFNELLEAIQRVRELHKPVAGIGITECAVCVDDRMHWTESVEYPCSTIKALDGITNEA